jgi:nitric oxide reductase subunit B
MAKSGLWKHGLLLTLLFGFTVMVVGGYLMYQSRAPIPKTVVAPNGQTLFTASDIQQGQELFRKRGLMNYGSVLGHGAYLGPDYTAESLHWMTEAMQAERTGGKYSSLSVGAKAAVDAEIAAELRQNRYRSDGTLRDFGRDDVVRGQRSRSAVLPGIDPVCAAPLSVVSRRCPERQSAFRRRQ